MADTSGIDRFFDSIDKLVDTADGVLNRGKTVGDKAGRVAESFVPRAQSTGVATRPRVRVIESIDGSSGDTTWIVTDGNHRAECNSAELAAKVRRAMEQP